jgi:hypothetical protein
MLEENLSFTNKSVKSKFALIIGLAIALIIGGISGLFFNFINKGLFIPIGIGGFISAYIFNYNSFNKITITPNGIVFLNTFFKRKHYFGFSEITKFKSNISTNPITNEKSFNIIELEFGNKLSINLNEKDFDDFELLKHTIHSKIITERSISN